MKISTSKPFRFVRSFASFALVLTSQPAFAGKPATGSGGGGIPPGVIYYQSASVTLPGSTKQMFSMKADGSQKTPLGLNNGLPSALTHGGSRWFLRTQAIAGQTNLGSGQRHEVFAVREDGGASVQLTNDPAMLLSLKWTPSEAIDDAYIAGVGQRYNGDGTVDAASVGVYAAILQFDANGNVMGLAEPPAFLVSIGGASEFSFAPDMTRLVKVDASGLRIVDVATGVGTLLVASSTRESVNSPKWSPNGAKIIFTVDDRYVQGVGRVDTISPDGTGRATLVKTRAGFFYSPTWSPDSSSVAYLLQDVAFSKIEMYRASAAGSPNEFNFNLLNASLAGWR